VQITAALAHHLQILSGDPERGDPERAEQITAGLTRLGIDVARTVPSCLAVSIVLRRWGADVIVGTLTRDDASTPVLASLAVPLSGLDPGDLLILQAGALGAFLLLAPVVTGESLAAALADLRVVNQGVGVLLDQGLTPKAAREELKRRAHDADTTLGVASRMLLDSLPRRAQPSC